MSVMAWVGPKGTTTKTVNAASTTMNGAIQKITLSASAGMMFLSAVLDRRRRSAAAVQVDPHASAQPHLHVRESCAQPVHDSHLFAEYQKDVDRRPKNVSRAARRLVAVEVGLNVQNQVVHQRSTSPRTISRVPMTAITSATSCPRHMTSSACRFTKDGGRTRILYGCVDPSLTMKYPSSPLGASIEADKSAHRRV